MSKKQIAKYIASMLVGSLLIVLLVLAVDVMLGEWAGWALVSALFVYSIAQSVRVEIHARRSDAE